MMIALLMGEHQLLDVDHLIVRVDSDYLALVSTDPTQVEDHVAIS